MSDMVSVPAEKIAALREAYTDYAIASLDPDRQKAIALSSAARAVVDAVETEDEPLCTCGHDKRQHSSSGLCTDERCWNVGSNDVRDSACQSFTPAPSPARDAAEWRYAQACALDDAADEIQPAWFGDSKEAFLAGFAAAEGPLRNRGGPMSAGDRDTLTELLREALKQQIDAVEGWHSPWVSDDATPEGLIQVDGDLDLRILADAILTSGWFRAAQAQAWDESCDFHYREGAALPNMGEGPCDENPYRSDPGDEFQNPED